MKVNLLHIKYDAQGGTEKILQYYLEQFISWGWDISLFTSKVNKKYLSENIKLKIINLNWLPRTIRLPVFNLILNFYNQLKAADVNISMNKVWHADIACANGNHIGYCRAQKKVFKTLHDRVKIWLDQKTFDNAKIIIACSKLVYDELLDDYGQAEEKLRLLPAPIDANLFNSSHKHNKAHYQAKYKIDNSKLNFLFVSTGHKRKGLDILLEVFADKKLAQHNLYVAGSKFKSTLANVHSLGFCREMHELYAATDCLLHPAKYEPYGLVVPEAISCGSPCIVSPQIGASYLVTSEVGIIAENLNTQTWVDLISNFNPDNFNIPDNFAYVNKLDVDSYMKELRLIIESIH